MLLRIMSGFLVVGAFGLSACGHEKDAKSPGTPVVTQAKPESTDDQNAADESITAASDLEAANEAPTMIIARESANGEIETRALSSSVDIRNGKDAAYYYEKGRVIQINDKVGDELGYGPGQTPYQGNYKTGTTVYNTGHQSHCCRTYGSYYWSTPWYPGKLLGRGLWWGRNPYISYGNRTYNYSNYNRWQHNGFNYHYYYAK